MKNSVIGVVVVTYRSSDVIVECLESLLASQGVTLKVVVVDNASPDGTVALIRDWASGAAPYVRPANSPLPAGPPVTKPVALSEWVEADGAPPPDELGPLTLLHARLNRGYAGAVNMGLKALKGRVDFYWVVNPDCAVPPQTAAAFAAWTRETPGFGLVGSPVLYYARPDTIQTAGGAVSRFTGNCRHRCPDQPLSALEGLSGEGLDWVTGANLVVSPAFLEKVGYMREDYFLYYEEVDWAFRRGGFPIDFLPHAPVYHHGGTSIGSGTMLRAASAFSDYLNYRNQTRFSRRFLSALPVGSYLYGLGKAVQLVLRGGGLAGAWPIVAGALELPPPKVVAQRIDNPQVAALAFGRHSEPAA